jgi:steroid delta-isomerase-like uncharacterized protein
MDRYWSITGRVGTGLAVALLATGCNSLSPAQRNMDIVRQMTDAINKRDFDALDELVAPDIHRHSGATPGLVIESLDEFKAFLRQDVAAVPDSNQEIEFMFADGEYVGVRCMYRGTQRGAWGPFPASGKSLELPFIGILRIENDQVAEIWVEWDNLNALTQLGHMPGVGDVDSN